MSKKIVLTALCLAAGFALADEPQQPQETKVVAKTKGWIEDFAKAKTEAAANKQPIFAFFTGSDWCGWCVKLRSEVLDQKEFKEFADANLVLFEADFPQRKKLPAEVKQQNTELAKQYQVQGYPTVFLLDADGKVLGKTGYQRGGAAAYVANLRTMLATAGVKAGDAAATPDADAKAKAEEEAKVKAEQEAKAKAEAEAEAKAKEAAAAATVAAPAAAK